MLIATAKFPPRSGLGGQLNHLAPIGTELAKIRVDCLILSVLLTDGNQLSLKS